MEDTLWYEEEYNDPQYSEEQMEELIKLDQEEEEDRLSQVYEAPYIPYMDREFEDDYSEDSDP